MFSYLSTCVDKRLMFLKEVFITSGKHVFYTSLFHWSITY